MTRPYATARLQLHAGFTLDDAAEQADYYAALGLSHLYLSPIFTARAGSTHGYDITDPTEVNPELGGRPALERLAGRLRALGLGIILDIVPNHMAALSPANAWWADVLRHGQDSRQARTFDIDWERPGLAGKILLPVLGQPYGQALAAGEIELLQEPRSETWQIGCAGQLFPLCPASEARLRAEGRPADLHALLEEQHYRLAWWRTAADEINWRRFFEISELVGVRVELPEVFEQTHALIFQLFREGIIDGVRVDHVDGLADPAGYLQRLRARLDELAPERPDCREPVPAAPAYSPYLIVEKILAQAERLRPDWPIQGSTGYDFMDEVAALLHDPAGEAPLTELWQEVAPGCPPLDELLARARHALLTINFASEYTALTRLFKRLADSDPTSRDFTRTMLRRSLGVLLESFRLYRTYFRSPEGPGRSGPGNSGPDAASLASVMARARGELRPGDEPILEQLGLWLSGAAQGRAEAEALRREAVSRFQQLTSPLAAKSLEDTVFYRYGRLLSRNEVGSDPALFALSAEDFHERMLRRQAEHPDSLLATATHDHKRGEDARARLAVLSELPDLWAEFVRANLGADNVDRAGPDRIDRYMLLQTLVGAWPYGLAASDKAGLRAFLARVGQWQTKALREAKRHSNWLSPNLDYERACARHLEELGQAAAAPNSLLGNLERLVADLGPAGAVNSLAQVLLRLTAPGLPDLYQGTELWDFNLVDPDNRRPVDFKRLRELNEDERSLAERLAGWRDGGIKQWLIRRLLRFRGGHRELFSQGEYLPLPSLGRQGQSCLAFLRRHNGQEALALTTRLAGPLLAGRRLPRVEPELWGKTAVRLPEECGRQWLDAITGQTVTARGGEIYLKEALAQLPVALLVSGRH